MDGNGVNVLDDILVCPPIPAANVSCKSLQASRLLGLYTSAEFDPREEYPTPPTPSTDSDLASPIRPPPPSGAASSDDEYTGSVYEYKSDDSKADGEGGCPPPTACKGSALALWSIPPLHRSVLLEDMGNRRMSCIVVSMSCQLARKLTQTKIDLLFLVSHFFRSAFPSSSSHCILAFSVSRGDRCSQAAVRRVGEWRSK